MRKGKCENVKKLAISLSIMGLVFAASSMVLGQKASRITFARGATSATVSGRLNGYKDEKIYVLRVHAGQTLTTSQIGNAHNITIFIENPDGEEVGDSDASCNNRREITPTEAGNYHLRVVECQKADRWRGTFKFRVTVR